MQLTATSRQYACPPWKHLALLLLLTATFCCAGAQTITLSLKKVPVEAALKEIEKRTNYRFVYTNEDLETTHPVTIDVKDASINTLLQRLFEEQPLTYTIDDHFIILRLRPKTAPAPRQLSGRVLNEKREPLSGASVLVRGKTMATATNSEGYFFLHDLDEQEVLVVSNIGYHTQEIATAGRNNLEVSLSLSVNALDETVVIAYGTTTQRLNTGNVTRITAEQIGQQPVSNPLAALEGRVAGMNITQTSGVAGSTFKVEIRGRTAIDQNLSRNDPLFVIDGVPFEPGNLPANQLPSAANNPNNVTQDGLSPLNTINPADIESIEVLKDADATSIYGSRGANGVVLITTKKGRPGKTKFDVNVYSGASRVTRTMDMLNTQQYIAMRREAFANDNVVPTPANAPEIFLWDTTRYTDLKKLLIGGTAHSVDAEASVSGGTTLTQFLVGGGYHRETGVFASPFPSTRASLHFNIGHNTADKKFSIQFIGYYSYSQTHLPLSDPTQYINLPPNMLLYDSLGHLNWQEKGITFSNLNNFTNPLAPLRAKFSSTNANLQGDLKLTGRLTRHLTARLNAGYNTFSSDENFIYPIAAIDPTFPVPPFGDYSTNSARSWLLEPQLEWDQTIGKGKLTALAGGTWQSRNTAGFSLEGSNYTSDLFIQSLRAAGAIVADNNYSLYRYTAGFGRINYNWKDRYLLNASARRDGSSRFGPGKQFATFSAIGAAWIFSSTALVQKKFSFLSYGKLRGSYGNAGNDQIGNYKFFDLWTPTSVTYQGSAGLTPSGLFNADYHWEVTRKLEAAIELGFFRDRLLVSADWYRNRSSNQLVSYPLASQSGFTTVTKNLPALVQNTGWEMSISSRNIEKNHFSWNTTVTLTLPRNKLVSFPGLSKTGYAASLVLGQSLGLIYKYRFLGVDPQTGIYQFEDVNKDTKYTSADNQVLGNTDSKYYGSFGNTVSYKGLQLEVFFEFKKQTGKNYLDRLASYVPGTLYNQPVIVLKRWQQPGNQTDVQKFTYNGASAAAAASITRLGNSDGVYSDASYVRLKNVSISYSLPANWMSKLHIENSRVYLQAQNLATFTSYKGSDPETQNFNRLPTLRTIVAGIQLSL
jgi:TonB-linked SusC/RagA family outer membrane protein